VDDGRGRLPLRPGRLPRLRPPRDHVLPRAEHPARYVFGYIPEIDCPPLTEPMDFAAWFKAYVGGRWHMFDARNNIPRTGGVVVGRGRDAVDVALITSFGPLTLTGFEVRAQELALES
jgi:transglutaminase-like putative cysteine protease